MDAKSRSAFPPPMMQAAYVPMAGTKIRRQFTVMRPPSSAPKVVACDPVAASIENRLRGMAASGQGELQLEAGADGIQLSFGSATVRAENYDIALVRLARSLLDDGKVGSGLVDALRDWMMEGYRHARN